MKHSNFTKLIALVLCFIMAAGTLTSCLQGPTFNPINGTTERTEPTTSTTTVGGGAATTPTTTQPDVTEPTPDGDETTTTTQPDVTEPTPDGDETTTTTQPDVTEPTPDENETTTTTQPEGETQDPEEDPVDPNELFADSTDLADDALLYGSLANDVFIGNEDVLALVPADVKVEMGTSSLALSIKNVEEATAVEGEALSNLDVHISGIAANNTTPMTVMLGAILPAGLANTELKLYHVENGTPVLMTRVNSSADFAIHNQYVYDAETGNVTIFVASFSVFTAVKTTVDVWDGEAVAEGFASGTGTKEDPYIIKTAAQLVYFRSQVDAGVTYKDLFVKLDSDIDLNGKLFDPIGKGYVHNGGQAFMGTFDGGNHTIYNLYQNGWELDLSYSTAGGGLFASVKDATIKNLAMSGANIVMECIDMGTVVGYAQGECSFENIIVTNSKLANYQRYTGGVVGEVCKGDDVEGEYTHTFTNITVDSSVKVSSLWGDFDNACGGVIGGKWGTARVLMQNVTVAAELDAFSDVTAAYQWYAYRRCGMLIGHTEQNSPKSALNAAAEFLTCKNVNVYYGDWTKYTYYQFAEQTDDQGNRLWNSNYPWVRAEAGEHNGMLSNVRYGNPIVNGVAINTIELAEEKCTDKVTITFNQLYGGGQGVYGTNNHEGKGVTIHYSLKKTIYINNNLGWTNLELDYWFANGDDRWTTVVDGMGITQTETSGIYRVDLPAYADGFKITGTDGYEATISTPEILLSELTENSKYSLNAFQLTLNADGVEALDVITGNWLYNTPVYNDKNPRAERYDVIVYDENYTGDVKTNPYGVAIVLNKDGNLIKIYDGANRAYWTVDGKKEEAENTHFTTSDYATVAWTELQSGETLIVFPNEGQGTLNASRSWALKLRNLIGKTTVKLTTTINNNIHNCTNVCQTCFGCANKACDNVYCVSNRCYCVEVHFDVNINGFDNTLVVTQENWLYNTQVYREEHPWASHYNVLVYDKDYTGTFTTNGFGIALVIDADGKLVKAYNAAIDGKTATYYSLDDTALDLTLDVNNYAEIAWTKLAEGETLIIFPNHAVNNVTDNTVRDWARTICNNWATVKGSKVILTANKLPQTIYFQDNQKWNDVTVNAFDAEGNVVYTSTLGEAEYFDGTFDIQRVKLPASAVKVVFSKTNSDIMTPEITSFQNGHIYIVNGDTVNSCEYVPGYKTIYFQNNWTWKTPSVYTYYTGANGTWDEIGFPGSAMQLHKSKTDEDGDGTYDIYKIVIPAYATAIVFNDGTQANVAGHQQSVNLTYADAKDGYIYSMIWDGDNTNDTDNLLSAKYVSGYKTIYFQNNWQWATPQYNYMGVTLDMKKETISGTIMYSFNLPNFATEFKVLGNNEESINIANSSVSSGKIYCMLFSNNQKKLTESTKIYFTPNTYWKNAANSWYAAYIWVNDETVAWIKMISSSTSGTYECYVPVEYDNVIFCRMGKNSTTAFTWENRFNQTDNLKISNFSNDTYKQNEEVYLKPNDNWYSDEARFAAYFFGNGEKWVGMVDREGDGVYECEIPSGFTQVIFCRMNPNASENNWNNKWNQTGDLTINTDGKKLFTVPNSAWDGSTTTWSNNNP